jgi:phosphoribosylpyrophosphate synthetase
LAKNKYNTNVQKLFFDLYFVAMKRFFVKELNEKKYSHVILSPLRKERIFFSSWHVNLFYEEVFSYIIQNNLVDHDFNLISPHFLYKKKKQGLMSFEKRVSAHSNVKKNEIYISYLNMYDGNINNQNILLLDDVLTTGKTALLAKEICDPYFNNCSWDLFSLFRTPQKGLSSK